jgi:cytochrome c peroxidase
MRKTKVLAAIAMILGAWAMPTSAANPDALRTQAAALFGAIASVDRDITPAEALGRQLSFDRRTAADGKTACVACRLPGQWAADGLRFSTDARGKKTSRNAPTIFNISGQFAQRWRADRPNAAAQAEESLIGSLGWPSFEAAVAELRKLDYASAFRRALPDDTKPLSSANFGGAVAACQATLTTPGPFDRFLSGQADAVSAQQRQGLELFITAGCAGCHNGPLVGGRLQQTTFTTGQ